jgi:Transposase DDE domain
VAAVVHQIKESDLQSWKLLRQFRARLQPYLAAASQTPTEQDPRCQLLAEDYFCLLLFGLFNPTLRSMRALCHASGRLARMREVCSRPMAAASFSEGQHRFEPEVLAMIIRELANEIKGRAEFGDRRLRQAVAVLTAVDGTVLRAVNRMAWASVGKNGSAVKLHLHFSVFDQVPQDWTITPGNGCERKVLKSKVQSGAFYVADRLYSDDYAFLGRMLRQKIDYVMRLPGNATRLGAAPNRELSAQDRAAGVVSDRMEQLGAKHRGLVIRVVEIHAAGQVFVLGTSRQDLPAELIGLIYRYRWQIELFFKWFKMILGSRRWLAESPQGVAIQLYSAMIATLLLTMVTGRRPTIRQLETLHLYFVGFASEDELLRELGLQKS